MSVEGYRQAKGGDLERIQALVTQAYAPYEAQIGVRPGPLDEDYAALIAAGRMHVVERNGDMLGLLVLIPLADALLLENIAVSPKAHGLGLGRALLAVADDAARAAGYDRLRLYTHEKMARNLAIYTRWGYVETHRVEERGLRRVYMEKRLSSGSG